MELESIHDKLVAVLGKLGASAVKLARRCGKLGATLRKLARRRRKVVTRRRKLEMRREKLEQPGGELPGSRAKSARQDTLYNPGVPYVYILRCGDGSLYTGITTDLPRRLEQHRAGRASRYTRSRLPVELVWSGEVGSWSLALREERRIKSLSRVRKEEMLRCEGVCLISSLRVDPDSQNDLRGSPELMPPRISFKPDASFFEKLVIGVVGAEAVRQHLATLGHGVVELERGALEPKLWKEVKRKRARVPDLVCTRCGQRIESRAKTRPELSMSHSVNDSTRSWDAGLIPGDWIAFPVCSSATRRESVQGRLAGASSYWRERRWAHWQSQGAINVFDVASLLGSLPKPKPAKGVTEGSESQVYWPAVFATRDGVVTTVDGETIRYAGGPGTRERRARISGTGQGCLTPAVTPGDPIRLHQVLAASVPPLSLGDLACRGDLDDARIASMLQSRRESVRYAGCRLAKLRRTLSVAPLVRDLSSDPAEDLYTRLEARSYLVTVAGVEAQEVFGALVSNSSEAPWRLESIVTLADTPAPSALELLKTVLANPTNPLFLRSAAAWALGRFPGEDAAAALVATFTDVDRDLRQEAVAALLHLGTDALEPLLEGLGEGSEDMAAGCFEVLRRLDGIPVKPLVKLAEEGRAPEWPVWLLASLPRLQVGSLIASWQTSRPDLHFALSVLWSFLESWVSETWEKTPDPQL